MQMPRTVLDAAPRSQQSLRAPYEVGDRVRGISYIPPEWRNREAPRHFEGVVVQVGSGYAGADKENAFLWAKMADCREVQALISEVELVSRGGREQER